MVPDPAKTSLETYLKALKRIISDEKVDLVVPGVGIAEACPLARLYDEIPSKVFFAPSNLIDTLNDKNEFFKLAKEYDTDGVAVPHTMKIHDTEELRNVLGQLKKTEHPSAEFFIKRIADSRNRERDTRRGTAAGLEAFEMLPNEPYVLQPFIEGKEYTATFSVDNGVMTSLVVSNGEMVNLTYYNCPQHAENITAWLEDFLAGINYNGWGSIDLIHREADNKLFVLEFNPRLHSCAVLFNEDTIWTPDSTKFYQPPVDNKPCYWLGNELLKTAMGKQPVSILAHRLGNDFSVLSRRDDPWVELANWIQYSKLVVDTYITNGFVDIVVLDNCIMKAIVS